MNIKLKDLLEIVNTSQLIQLESANSGETFYPTYSDMSNEYGGYYVTNIISSRETLLVTIEKEFL